MLKTSGNVLTLLLTGLSATDTTSSSCFSKKEYYSSLVSSVSDNPKRLWQTINKFLHRKSSSVLLALHMQTALLLFSPAKYPDSVSLSPATPYIICALNLSP